MAWWNDVGKAIGTGVSTLAGVGLQVTKGVVGTGVSIVKGGVTAVTNPKKFVEDVHENLSTWGSYIGKSAKSGTDMIKEGWDDVKKGGNPGLLFVKAMGGMAQISSLGMTAAVGEHLEKTVIEETDELGNVSGYSTKEGTDALTRLGVWAFGKTAANAKNINTEIEEALDSGDAKKANKIFGQAALAAGGKAVKVAGIAVGVAAAIPTGGASLGAVAAGIATGSGIAFGAAAIGNRMTEHGEVQFDALNVEDDVEDMKNEYIKAALAAGNITEADAEAYGKIVETVYQNATYKAMDPTVIQQMGYSNAKEMTSAMLQAYGYDTGNLAVIDMSREDKSALYMEQFQQYVDDGTYTSEQAQAMANLQVSYEAGDLDLRGYSRSMAYVSVYETGMSGAEKSTYADRVAGLVCGDYSPDQFQEMIRTDPLIGRYVGDDGNITFPAKDQATPAEQFKSAALSGIGSAITGARATLYGVTSGSSAKAADEATVTPEQDAQAKQNQDAMTKVLAEEGLSLG